MYRISPVAFGTILTVRSLRVSRWIVPKQHRIHNHGRRTILVVVPRWIPFLPRIIHEIHNFRRSSRQLSFISRRCWLLLWGCRWRNPPVHFDSSTRGFQGWAVSESEKKSQNRVLKTSESNIYIFISCLELFQKYYSHFRNSIKI